MTFLYVICRIVPSHWVQSHIPSGSYSATTGRLEAVETAQDDSFSNWPGLKPGVEGAPLKKSGVRGCLLEKRDVVLGPCRRLVRHVRRREEEELEEGERASSSFVSRRRPTPPPVGEEPPVDLPIVGARGRADGGAKAEHANNAAPNMQQVAAQASITRMLIFLHLIVAVQRIRPSV